MSKLIPRMDTFSLPVSPSHIAVTAGIVLTQLSPGLAPEPKGIITAGIVGVYVLGEVIFASVKAKKLDLPTRIVKLAEERLTQIESGK